MVKVLHFTIVAFNSNQLILIETTIQTLCLNNFLGKQRRLKQAKEEAQDEIEKYRAERERQFKEFEAKVCN